MFKDDLKTEWQRLSPIYTRSEDGLFKAMWNAGRETLPGYFAPAQLAWRLIKRFWRYAMPQSNRT